MPAISKAWVSILDAAVDPDSPIDTALMTGLRDDLVHLREWLGAAYTAGATQNHTHDGTNSALVEWAHMAVFTASGTWTVPAGVTRCKVTVVGGGGGGADGTAGSDGGTSSFGAHCSATGGGAGTVTAGNGGGIGVSGDLNIRGGHNTVKKGGDSFMGGGGSWYVSAPGGAYGAGGGGNNFGGAGAGTAIKIVTGLVPAATVTVTVGAAGAGGGATGFAGSAGVVVIEY